jgi:hypothetical protein
MQTIVISLLIVNITVVAAGATVIGKEISRLNKKVESLEKSVDVDSMGKELKDHISKEFMGLSFRWFRWLRVMK